MMNDVTNNRWNRSNHGSLDDEKVTIKKIQNGNAKAFKNLMKEYIGELADFAFHYVKSSHIAKDIVQDVFANIWEKRTSWYPRKSLKMYMYQSVKNEALKTLRDQKTERKYMKLFMQEEIQRVATPEIPVSVESDDFKQAVHRAIEDLPERARMVYKLHRREGLTYREIAEVMDISYKTVESQMSRALKKLRDCLSSYLLTSY